MDNKINKSSILTEFSNLAFGFLDRFHDDNIETIAKRNKLTKILKLNQIHSNNVHIIINEINTEKIREGDSLITNQKGIGIGIYTADCVPILLYDKQSNVVAAVHAGWKGSLFNILSQTIENMKIHFKSDPKNIYTVIGPSIGKCCYVVGENVISKFIENYSRTDSFIHPLGNSKFILNLKKFNSDILNNLGVSKIEIIDECTNCNENYFSYRREGKGVGSQLSFIGLTTL